MKPLLPNTMRKRQLIGLAFLGVSIAAAEVGNHYLLTSKEEKFPVVKFSGATQNAVPLLLSEFNPNELDEKQWKDLGFSDKQIKTILNYKKVVGGSFKSKEQFKKCYAVSAEKFEELETYLLLPETNKEASAPDFDHKKFQRKEITVSRKFNPDLYTAAQWMSLGFSENQANAILKYRTYLGGSFVSKEKFKECFIISDENYQKLAPHLILPDKTPENYSRFTSTKLDQPKFQYRNFDPNLLDLDGWKAMGFTEKQAAAILKYKNVYLKGSFRTLEDVQKCYMITDRFEAMKSFIQLNPENIKAATEKSTFVGKQENSSGSEPEGKTDFANVDLNQITFKQLREFGFTEKDAAMMLSFRKKLGGFVNKNQIPETFEIDRDLAAKLTSSTKLNTASVAKYSLMDAPENWLKTHPYFKYSADKIIYYRISETDEKKIWKLLKLKPEYETKMRLYLK